MIDKNKKQNETEKLKQISTSIQAKLVEIAN